MNKSPNQEKYWNTVSKEKPTMDMYHWEYSTSGKI